LSPIAHRTKNIPTGLFVNCSKGKVKIFFAHVKASKPQLASGTDVLDPVTASKTGDGTTIRLPGTPHRSDGSGPRIHGRMAKYQI
jgi:hypothetical protein